MKKCLRQVLTNWFLDKMIS